MNLQVKGYRVFGGDKVDANGHGTHVVGTILGNPSGSALSPLSHAPSSRI